MRSEGFTPPGSVYDLISARRATMAALQGTVAARCDHITRARKAGPLPSSPPVVARQPVTVTRFTPVVPTAEQAALLAERAIRAHRWTQLAKLDQS